MGNVTAFDRLFDEASPLIQRGLHQRDIPSVEGGRWGVSVVLRPDPASAVNLERTMSEVEVLVGPGHFRTGTAGSVHFTVRVLEAYREAAGEDDDAVQRYARAMCRAAREVDAIELGLVGLTLTRGSVMACAYPVDGNADRFMDLLKDELGDDAWVEAGFTRDIWYANILHFGAGIAQPAGLVEWVAHRRELDFGRAVMDTAELVRFRYEDGAQGRLMRPEVLAEARTLGVRRTVTRDRWRRPSLEHQSESRSCTW
jgi:hypothetical protein